MARGVNKVILIGSLGKDPETRFMPSGAAVCSFSVATNEQWTDQQSGQKQERTEWSNITIFGKLAEIADKYLKKGSQVYLEGKLRTEQYEKDGITRYSTKVIVNELQMLGGRPAGQQDAPAQQNHQPAAQSQQQNQQSPHPVDDDGGFDDEIPF